MEKATRSYAIRYILQGLSPADVENVFRQHAADLNHAGPVSACMLWRSMVSAQGSFDNFNDVKAKQVLSAFAVNTALFWRISRSTKKSNEIPAVQKLLEELDVRAISSRAMRCIVKKNLRSRRRRERASDRSTQRQSADLASPGNDT